MATKEEVLSAEVETLKAELRANTETMKMATDRLTHHKIRMRRTIDELRAGMNQQHAANRLAKMARELFGEEV